MASIIEISQAANPLLTFAPIFLMIFSGYAGGTIISSIRGKVAGGFLKDFIHGSIVLNFLFVSGFVIFGAFTVAAREYFTAFTYAIVALSILGIYLLLKKLKIAINSHSSDKSTTIKIRNIKSLLLSVTSNQTNIFNLFAIALFISALVHQGIIIYFHPIYTEYDSIFRFLPISKSILLGNGLNHDFYLGSEINMRYPPFTDAINAWLIQSFEYSSLRMFPFYYIILATVLVYSLTRNILTDTSEKKNVSFFALIASTAFLITPAILVTSSRFSLQQDLAFIFMLTSIFYLLSEIVPYVKPSKRTLLMLSVSLALMALTREIGLLIAVAIFFLVPAIKYTESNVKLRALFTIFSFGPLYLYDVVLKGKIEANASLLVILLANLAVFYIASQIKNQNKFSSLVKPASNFKDIAPLIIPIIFIFTNILMFNGLYPDVSLSHKFNEAYALYAAIFTQQNVLENSDLLFGIPRMDILLVSVAVGSLFIFFKLVGIGRIVYDLKNNNQYALILILMIFLLVIWSFALQSGFKSSDIRHVAYFVPILTVVLVLGMKTGRGISPLWILYYYGVIVFATYYFISQNLHVVNYNNIFAGFWIDPFKNSIMSVTDVVIAAILLIPLLILTLNEHKPFRWIKQKSYMQKYTKAFVIAIFGSLLLIQVYTLSSSGVTVGSIDKIDQKAQPGWENNIFQVIDYLQSAEKGNVFAVRAPAISFFTNRTNFDLFNSHVFEYAISDLLSNKNSTLFKNSLLEMGIRYIILPNERSNLYHLVQNLTKRYQVLNTFSNKDFEKISFKNFDVYKYIPTQTASIDLINKNYTWKPFGKTTVVQNPDNLIIAAASDKEEKIYNRAYMQTEIKLADRPLLFSLNYVIDTKIGKATYVIEIRENNGSRIIFNSLLGNTAGKLISQTYLLPKGIVNKQLEFRLYIVPEGPGHHSISVKKASVMYT